MQNLNYFTKKNFNSAIKIAPNNDLSIIVVLPSYNELNLSESLKSLENCDLPRGSVEVIVVVNYPEGSADDVAAVSEQSVLTVEKFNHDVKGDRLRFFAIKAYNLPRKQAGVGFARQIGMDEAAYRFLTIGKSNGVIACYDADSSCMPNYLCELEKLWNGYPKTSACSIRYQHPIEGIDFSEKIYSGIVQYELHLRYYNQASRYIGFPFAYHTVGSSMACSAAAYVKFGGMNRHQAGEDFYFLQKIIPHGNFRELNSTCIFPSPRLSDRVPFGTGRAMTKYLGEKNTDVLTYNLNSFIDLIPFMNGVDEFYTMDDEAIGVKLDSLPKPLAKFLYSNDVIVEINRVKHNTSNAKSFRKRFFLWFDAFMLLKYLNFVNDTHYPKQPVCKEATKLGHIISLSLPPELATRELLAFYREKDLEEWVPKL